MLENGPWLWQSNSFYTNYSVFYQFCDAIENVAAGAAVTPNANGVGLEKALAGYANYVNTTIIPGCKSSVIVKTEILTVILNRLPRFWLYQCA
jgi:hypothetical protein